MPLGVAKQRGLLAILLYHAGDPVRVDLIAEHLWGGRSVGSYRENLYPLASRLRAVLRTAGLPRSLTRVSGVRAYRLDVDPANVDYHQFRRLVNDGREAAIRGDHGRCVELLDRAVRLWRGEPLAELHGATSEHLRRELHEKLLGAHRSLIESELVVGRAQVALTRLEPLMSAHPLDEALARLWVSALLAVGREHEAQTFATVFASRYRKQMRIEPALDLSDLPFAGRPAEAVRGDARAEASGDDSGRRARPNQLPSGIPDFIGHEDLLAELDSMSRGGSANAVVLAGMPGVGKSTLAIHWAQRHRAEFPDGQLYLNAEGHGALPAIAADEAIHRLLVALGVPGDKIPADPIQRRSRYHEELNGRRILIVVDNVLDSEQVRPLIPMTGTCLLVITSRIRLKGLTIRDGIRTITVQPLPEAAQEALLGGVVRTTRSQEARASIQALARLSGGLPLALRIIGEHVAARPRARIADLIEDLAIRLLDCEGDETDDATLRTVFAWSYRALAPPAATLFRCLGLFPGATIDVLAASVLTASGRTETERALNTLARAHLINHDDARRYRLHDLIQRYAVERADHEISIEDRRVVTRRLLDWYLLTAVNAARVLEPESPLVPDLPVPDEIEPLTFAVDRDATRWCEVEQANLYALAGAAAAAGFHRLAWQLPNTVYQIFDRYGRQEAALRLQELALQAAIADRHDVGRAGTLGNLGAAYFALHDLPNAADAFEEGLRLARRIGFTDGQMACLHNLAVLRLKAGEVSVAVEMYDELLVVCQESGHLIGQANVHIHLGDAHRQLGARERAVTAYLDALALWREIGSMRQQGNVHARLAALHLESGDSVAALNHCRLALDVYHHTTDEVIRCAVLIVAADAHRQLGQLAEAARDASTALAISDAIADGISKARALEIFAGIQLANGRRDAAYAACLEARRSLGDNVSPEAAALRERLRVVVEGSVEGD